jgi:iron complex transport system permease protein
MTGANDTPVTSPARPPAPLLPRLAAVTLVVTLASMLIGPNGIGWPARGPAAALIFYEIRLPRALLGLLVGATLGASGAALQGYLRNPLAEPGILGVSGGAALGAVLAIHSGLAAAAALALPIAGFLGAAAAAALLLALAVGRPDPVTLLLAGVAVSAITGAATNLALNLSANPFAAAEAVFWMMGSLADRSVTQLALAGPLMVAGLALLSRLGPALDALSLGDDVAATLGRDARRDRLHLVAGISLGVGAATAVTGSIGFIGLIVPHLLLIAASAFGGAILLLIADAVTRLLAPIADVRVGVLTALVGAPFFLWLLVRHRVETPS